MSQSGSIQTSSQSTVLSKEACRSFNTSWLSDGSTFSDTGSSIGHLALKGLSPSTQLRPIEERNLIADQSLSGCQERELDKTSNEHCKSDTLLASYAGRVSVTVQRSSEAQISGADLISDIDQISNVVQLSDADQMSDTSRLPVGNQLRTLDGTCDADEASGISQENTSRTSRLLGTSQNSDIPPVDGGNVLGDGYREEDLKQRTAAADESNDEETDL